MHTSPKNLEQVSHRRPRAPEGSRHAHEVSLEHLRLALETLDDGIWVWELPTDELLVNRRWLNMLGYEAGDLEPSSLGWARLCHPDDLPEAERRMGEHLEGRSSRFEHELRLRCKDGAWVWVLNRARVVTRDAQGHPLRLVGSSVEITERKHGEERTRALLQALPDLIFRQSIDGTYRDFLASRPEELLVPIDALIGSNIRQLPMPRPLIDRIFTHLERAIHEGTLEVFEYELEVAQGRQCYESRIVRSGPDEAVCIIRNVTDRKRAEERLRQQEEELRRHRDRLEELVQHRTERLLQATRELEERQAQLIQAEKLASLGQMAAGVAHEISSPVGYVLSNLGTLSQYLSVLAPLLHLQRELLAAQEPAVPGAQAEVLTRLRELWDQEDVGSILADMGEVIHESREGARRIKEIVQGLRMFAREDSGEPQLADLNAELESTLKMVWNELKYKCEVRRDFGPLPLIRCHPTQLAQVFTNLLLNGAQAIETRGELHLRTRHEGSEVVVQISDTGQGMTPETLSKLSTPFFTTKPRGQGTGLGLSVSYSIISSHQGRIEVRSEVGKGSTFTIRLPVREG